MRDERRRDWEAEVTYEVWRRGGNPDRIDYDRQYDAYYSGADAEEFAHQELRRQQPPPPQQEPYYEQEEPQP